MIYITRALNQLASMGIWLIVWTYRLTLGHVMGGQCRHIPTCSQYMLDAVKLHGPWVGGYRGIKRILRCHPWGTSGYDPA